MKNDNFLINRFLGIPSKAILSEEGSIKIGKTLSIYGVVSFLFNIIIFAFISLLLINNNIRRWSVNMKKSDFKGIYAEMSEILGEEIVKIIHKHYKGQQVNFPMKLYSNEYVENYIIENYSEKTVREISRTLGYSDKWVQKLIKKYTLKLKQNI